MDCENIKKTIKILFCRYKVLKTIKNNGRSIKILWYNNFDVWE